MYLAFHPEDATTHPHPWVRCCWYPLPAAPGPFFEIQVHASVAQEPEVRGVMRTRKQMIFKVLMYVDIDENRSIRTVEREMAVALQEIAGDANDLHYAVAEYQHTNERLES